MSQSAAIDWADETPVSPAFQDAYFNPGAGLDEARHVFLAGNDLPRRLCDGFHVCETGFGTGLNLLAVADARAEEDVLRFTSFEAFPMAPEQMARALAPYARSLRPGLVQALIEAWASTGGPLRRLSLPGIVAEVHIGDARQTLPRWSGRADAWFLDGFAPARNPEMWGADLMAVVAARTAPGGTCASFTAAGQVRRALSEAGFTITRRPGFGRKRHMITGRMEGAA